MDEWRQCLPVTARCIYFQTGGKGPMSRPALQAMYEAELLAAGEGPVAPKAKGPLIEAANRARENLARLLGTSPRQLCWSLNTSTSMRTVLRSLRPCRGDLILTSDLEHAATRSLCAGLRDACGVESLVLPTGGSDEAFLERLDEALRSSPALRKILLLSHVSCIDGRRLSVTQAVALARKRGAVSLIDGAQAVGQFAVDLARIDADFYIASGHKWLLGPAGLGFIYVRADRLGTFNPNWLPDADRSAATAAGLGEAGSINDAPRAALGVAIEQVRSVGLGAIEAHVADLRRQLCAGLASLPGIAVLGPDDPGRVTGIVSFRSTRWDDAAHRRLVDHLYRQHQILIKYQPEAAALRVSLAAFNIADEVDALLHALRHACARGIPADNSPGNAQ